jgi:hypothetical protein
MTGPGRRVIGPGMLRAVAARGAAPTARRAAAAAAAAILLGVASIVWSALPDLHKGLADFALFLACGCAAGGALRLSLAGIPLPEDTYLLAGPLRGWLGFLHFLRIPPWEEGATLAVVWLEVMHPARPWHTAVLGAVLVAYLLAVHLAESDATAAGSGILGTQAPVLAVGAALLALGAGAGMLPAIAPGAGSSLLRVVAAAAAILAAALVLPTITTHPRNRPHDL